MPREEKTEKPTPQRLKEARKRGDIASSPELSGALVAIVSLFAFQQQGASIVNGLQALLSRDLAATANARSLTMASASARLRGDLADGLLLLLPFVVVVVIGAIVVGVLNTRGVVSFKLLKPSARKLNPVNGFKHLFGKDGLVLLLKAIVKLAIAVVIVDLWAPSWQTRLPLWPSLTVGTASAMLWQDSMGLALQITAAFAVVGAADFGYRYVAWMKRLRMTKQEVKDEFQRSEGNPRMRSRIRQTGRKRIRQLLGSGGVRKVPQADVVITNPTHFAVAIQYKAGSMRAPKVIAKGQRLVALRIKEAARTHNIPIVENKPLAQALFKSVEINQEIPADLYQAVAQVLAFVYRMRHPVRPRRPAASTARS